ncbi:Fumigermin synthase [Frankliniella fusca]|uniref:Fumigermin synthase n=1 Tax=Frankliniella fusca TaxID=407009 RepID=A0AAE1H1N7_9NEOP|nr:Fumigermin synthase [Frankliniella fusca]
MTGILSSGKVTSIKESLEPAGTLFKESSNGFNEQSSVSPRFEVSIDPSLRKSGPAVSSSRGTALQPEQQ